MTLTIVGLGPGEVDDLSRRAWLPFKVVKQCAWIFLFTLTFSVYVSVRAENNSPIANDSLIYEGGDARPASMYWWKDNFYFAEMAFEKKIYRYIPQTGELNEVENYPGKKQLTADQQAHYRAATEDVFVSPDGKLFFYTSQFDTYTYAEGGGRVHLSAVGEFPPEHYDKGKYFPLRIEEIHHPNFIRWSENSSSFAIEQPTEYGGQTNIWHVRIGRVRGELWNLDETYVGAMDVISYLFGISADGNRLLFPNYNGDLLLWDARTPVDENQYAAMENAQQLPFKNIAAAGFIPGDDQHILILNEQGIVRYDLKTQTTELLSDQVNSTWAQRGLFSPDNHYLAFLTKNNDDNPTYSQVHIISLANIENRLSGAAS